MAFPKRLSYFSTKKKGKEKVKDDNVSQSFFCMETQFWQDENVFRIFVLFPGSTKFYPKHVKLLQSCPTLCDHMDHSLPDSSICGILQARILDWVAVPSYSRSSCSRIELVSLTSPALTSRFFTSCTTWEAHPKVKQTANESNQLSTLRKVRHYSDLLILSVLFCLFSLSLEKVKVSEVTQSCPTLWDPVDCSLPGSSVHGILQARILQ